MKLILKYFFLADVLFWGVILDLDNYIYLGRSVFCGGHLRLETSCSRVNMVCYGEQNLISYSSYKFWPGLAILGKVCIMQREITLALHFTYLINVFSTIQIQFL
jgi:hypothetical protein